jgi:hypothetical protein
MLAWATMEATTTRIFMNTIQRLINGRKSPHSLAENAEVRFPSRLAEKHMLVLEQATRPQNTKDLYSFDPAGNGGTGAWSRIEFGDDTKEEAFPTRAFATALVINEKAYMSEDRISRIAGNMCLVRIPGLRSLLSQVVQEDMRQVLPLASWVILEQAALRDQAVQMISGHLILRQPLTTMMISDRKK